MVLNALWGALGLFLGALGGFLGVSWAPPGCSWGLLRGSWASDFRVRGVSLCYFCGSSLLRIRFFSSSKLLGTILGSTTDLPTLRNKVFASLDSLGSLDSLIQDK